MTGYKVPTMALALAVPLWLGAQHANTEHSHTHATQANSHAETSATQAMSSHSMHENPHMVMTEPRSASPEDLKRGEEIAKTLRDSLEKYKDYRRALEDGYRPFHPELRLPIYHFTNYRYGFEAAFRFDPAQPTSLLYKKTADGYELVGAMYTAPRTASEEELDRRVPLSLTRWHRHVNLCMPPRGESRTADWTKFGLAGSITTQEECTKAGGRFIPQVFGWMVHIYPFEQTPEKIWAH